MSEIKVNKITPRAACGTTQLGDSGDTFTVPAGATISNLGTATGFGGTGVVSWDTASIKTTGFTAVTGTGYFCDTTGGAFSVTLPLSPSAGDVVGVSDYAKTFDTDNLTLLRNGSNISGTASDSIISAEGIAVTLVYVDATKGWIVTDSGNQSDAPLPTYIAATGGCITTCGNFKMHTFFGPGTLCVSAAGNCAGSNTVSYMVVAGGAGGGWDRGGAGGAGGFRESKASSDSYTASPLNATCGAPGYNLPVSATPYAIVVGGGGAGGSTGAPTAKGKVGFSSSFSTITSAGGGGGGAANPTPAGTYGPGDAGGSGGGGSSHAPSGTQTGGAGNTPPTSPSQGSAGGPTTPPNYAPGGGGGGATAVGTTATSGIGNGVAGGAGAGTAINLTTMPAPSPTPSAQIGTPGPSPSVRYFSGGGGGGASYCCGTTARTGGPGGTGGGGAGGNSPGSASTVGTVGTINTGGGGGGGGNPSGTGPSVGGNGGSGIVVIRYKYQ